MKRFKRIYEEAKGLKQSYEPKKEDIRNKFAPIVHDRELQKLEDEYKEKFESIKKNINKVLEDMRKELVGPQEEYRKTDEYKDKLAYSIDMILKFGSNLDNETMDELLEPLVKAGDKQTLNILNQIYKNNLSVMNALNNINTNTDKAEKIAEYLNDFTKSYKDGININLTLEGQFLRVNDGGAE